MVDENCKKKLDEVFGVGTLNMPISGLCETCLCLNAPTEVNLKIFKTTEGKTVQLKSNEYPLSFNAQGLLYSFTKKEVVYISYAYNSGKSEGYAPINLYQNSEKTIEVFNAAKLNLTVVSTQAVSVKQTQEGKLQIENNTYNASPCFGENGDGNSGTTIELAFGQGSVKAIKGADGKWKVDYTLDPSKKSGKVKQSADQMEKEMEAAAEEQLNSLGANGSSAAQSGDGFSIQKMNAKEWLSEISDLGGNVWQEARLPKDYWDPADGSHGGSKIKMPPLFTGLADGGIDMVSDYPQLIKLAYDVSTDAQVRSGLWEGVKGISPSSVKDMAVGAMKEKWDKYANASPQVTTHEASFDAVGVAKVLSGGSLIAAISETGKKLTKKSILNAAELLKDILAKRTNIRKMLDADIGKDYARKYFNKYETGNFDEWYAQAKKYDLNDEINFEVHHVIPIKVLEGNKELQELLLWAKKEGKELDFNGIDNGIPLQKKRLKFEQTGHANHPAYDVEIGKKINEIVSDIDSGEIEKLNLIQNLIKRTKTKLENEVLLGTKDVNQILNF